MENLLSDKEADIFSAATIAGMAAAILGWVILIIDFFTPSGDILPYTGVSVGVVGLLSAAVVLGLNAQLMRREAQG
jgi:membrane-bound ClpP family serine protease